MGGSCDRQAEFLYLLGPIEERREHGEKSYMSIFFFPLEAVFRFPFGFPLGDVIS